MPNIVILDGHTLNPGDLDWSPLASLAEGGTFQCYDRTPAGEVLERVADADIVLTNKCPVRAEVISALPRLKMVGVLATGYNIVDVPACAARGISVANVPGYSTASVAQHVWALILELTNQVALHGAAVREGDWARCPDFCFTKSPLVELAGKTLGILGYGAIGKAVAQAGAAFGMKIQVHSRSEKVGVENVSLEALLATSDILSLHCPLDASTQGVIKAANLRKMKPTALLINTGRGPLVVESDLAEALNAGVIAGAGLDVLSSEPPAADNPLTTARNCLITPHLAWASKAARERLLVEVTENVRAFLAGQSRNLVG